MSLIRKTIDVESSLKNWGLMLMVFWCAFALPLIRRPPKPPTLLHVPIQHDVADAQDARRTEATNRRFQWLRFHDESQLGFQIGHGFKFATPIERPY